jgi:anthranilate synthase component II
LDAAQGRDGAGGSRERLGEVTQHGAWRPPAPPTKIADCRVLLIDNYDSFVYNLADYCAALGADVQVIRNDADWQAARKAFQPTHIVLSPGPGWPQEAGCCIELAKELHGELPLLGVCLGHQAIGEAHGGLVIRHPQGPVHGKTARVGHTGQGLFAGLSRPIEATRYHSLIVDVGGMRDEWVVDATLADGTVMALRHRHCPTFGLQFHPESLCTDQGLELLSRFLQTRAEPLAASEAGRKQPSTEMSL